MEIRIKKVFDFAEMPEGMYARSEGSTVIAETVLVHPADASKLVAMDDIRREATAHAFVTAGRRSWWHSWTDVSDSGEEGDPLAEAWFEAFDAYKSRFEEPVLVLSDFSGGVEFPPPGAMVKGE